jgi:hypothetical protein
MTTCAHQPLLVLLACMEETCNTYKVPTFTSIPTCSRFCFKDSSGIETVIGCSSAEHCKMEEASKRSQKLINLLGMKQTSNLTHKIRVTRTHAVSV